MLAVNGSALEAKCNVAFVAVDGGNLRKAAPTALLLVVGFEPCVHKIADTVALQLYRSHGFVPVSSLQTGLEL